MEIRYAKIRDYNTLSALDKHIKRELLKEKIHGGEIIVALKDENVVGWLRFNYFWDEIPFMNMLYILEDFRSEGIGSELVVFWERQMQSDGYNKVMTSTQVNESAQHFYRKLDYKEIGGFILPVEVMELLFYKELV